MCHNTHGTSQAVQAYVPTFSSCSMCLCCFTRRLCNAAYLIVTKWLQSARKVSQQENTDVVALLPKVVSSVTTHCCRTLIRRLRSVGAPNRPVTGDRQGHTVHQYAPLKCSFIKLLLIASLQACHNLNVHRIAFRLLIATVCTCDGASQSLNRFKWHA